MKIYKFKDLIDEKKHPHFYQIVLENTIRCSRPDFFNDENEFEFKLDYNPSPNTANLLAQVISRYRETNNLPPNLSASFVLQQNKLKENAVPIIEDIINNCRKEIGVASFSITKTDYLWNEHGGRGNGVCIEINIPDELVGKSYHRVHYVSEKIFHVDSFLESALFKDRQFETFRNILLTKTNEWSQEEEMRFIAKLQEENQPINGYISEIAFGAKVPASTLEQVVANIANHCSANNIKITRL